MMKVTCIEFRKFALLYEEGVKEIPKLVAVLILTKLSCANTLAMVMLTLPKAQKSRINCILPRHCDVSGNYLQYTLFIALP